MLLDKMSDFRHYRRCLVCDSLFDSSRSNGISLGIKQFEKFKYCSVKCRKAFERKRQTFTCKGSVCSLVATNTGKVFYFDRDKIDEVSKYAWYEDSIGYAQTCGNKERRHLRLHVLVKGKKDGFVIDHIDRDKSNNKDSNLRFVTVAQNIRNQSDRTSNRSGYRGIDRQKRKDGFCYSAKVIYNKKEYFLGRFDTAEEAYLVRKQKLAELDSAFLIVL